MPIPAQCQCGAKFAAPDHLAGKAVACPKCKQPLKIPAASGGAQPAAKQQAVKQKAAATKTAAPKADSKIPTQCQCGAKFAAPANLAGKKVACPKCKQPIQIPAGKQQSANQPAPAKKTPQPESLPSLGGGIDDLLDEVGVEGKKIGENYCPECGSEFKDEAIICVQCGFNRKTGRQLSTVKVKEAPTKVMDLSAPAGGLRTSSASSSGSGEMPSWVKPAAIVTAAITLLLFLCTSLVPVFGLLAGMLLIGIGAILANVGPIWIVVIAFQEDVTQGLLVFFAPFYLFFYVAKNWAETKLPFFIWLASGVIVFAGLGGMMLNAIVTVILFGEPQ